MKKLFFLLIIVLGVYPLKAFGQERPFIWVKAEERAAILDKIEKKPWAHDIYVEFIKQVNTDIQLHISNPEEFLKKLPFNWEKATPGETPPFYHTHHIVNGENRNLDNTTDEEWINGRKLIRYMQLGLDCGIAYYLSGDEKYAQCAIDILNAFVNGVLQSEVSGWKSRGGWLFPYDGFREVREIGYKVPLIYDFTAGFIKKGGQPFDIIMKKKTDFPLDKAQEVFRTYADITVNYGHTGSNHPVLEAPSLVYNALAMDNKKEREKLLSYFLTENTENQDALTVMASNYKNEGDIWPETSQYFNGVSTILTRLMLVVNKYNPSLRLGEKYSNVLFSLPALDYMVYPNGEIIRWGDGHREGTPSFASYEDAYLLGKMVGSVKITGKFASLLKKAFDEGKYKRKGIESVLWYNDEYGGETAKFEFSRTDVVPHAGIFLQRNLSTSGKPEDGMMCFVGGAHMVHGHAEGMNIELYGKGQVLGVDNGRGRYQQDIHENYSRIFAAHNTVIVNGSSQGDGGWANQGINTVQLSAMEPVPRQEAVSPNYSFTQTSFIDDKGDKAEAIQERTLALIRTSETSGYYVDVFRSKSKLPNEYHDYLYHNIGDKLDFLNSDIVLKPNPERFMANAKLPWNQNDSYRHPGWHFFKEVQSSGNYQKDLKVQFTAGKFENPLYMNLFIPGFENREYTKVMAPPTFEAPKPYENQSTPTLVIRKSGEAWENPFVAVYEPFDKNENNNSVQSVEKLELNGQFRGLKIVSKTAGKTLIQYILTQSKNQEFSSENPKMYFKGTFAIVTLNDENQLQDMYIGDGEELRVGKTVLKTNQQNRAVYKNFNMEAQIPGETNRNLTLTDFSEMQAQKKRIADKEPEALDSYTRLVINSDKALSTGPFSVMNKTAIPPSGSKHDYMTLAPYFWPNPDTPNGLPYIRKDGEVNPEARDNFTDFKEKENFFNSIDVLGKAFYYSKNRIYGEKAIALIRTWFLDEATKMNPHLNYGQGVRGVNDGRPFGIIEFGGIRELIECMEIMEHGGILDETTKNGIKSWLTEYKDWLQNSEIGTQERNTLNNHGTWYDVQMCSILLYLGELEQLNAVLEQVKTTRIASQIEPDGSQPRELARTKSFSYSTMNLSAFTKLAWFGEKTGVDLWNFETTDGRSIKKAYEYLIPYISTNKKWEYKQLGSLEEVKAGFVSLLLEAGKTFNEGTFISAAKQYRSTKPDQKPELHPH